jgi:hypothetical protein
MTTTPAAYSGNAWQHILLHSAAWQHILLHNAAWQHI